MCWWEKYVKSHRVLGYPVPTYKGWDFNGDQEMEENWLNKFQIVVFEVFAGILYLIGTEYYNVVTHKPNSVNLWATMSSSHPIISELVHHIFLATSPLATLAGDPETDNSSILKKL